ncbi:MAG: DNA polymerase I [Eubacteriaceae bacterium]|nr:DNA polymerase I [Eubacteriaceae bacterium]
MSHNTSWFVILQTRIKVVILGKKVVIIDSFSLIYKSFYAIKGMSAPDGTPTNAVHGFLSMLLKLLEDEKPDYLFAAFDSISPVFRKSDYEGYKEHREAMPEDLRAQLPVIKGLLEMAGVCVASEEGFEADDVIGRVSLVSEELGYECVVVTGDRDSFQLAGPYTRIAYSKRGVSDTIKVDEAYVKQAYGLEPSQLIDVKALMGDTSDNIPGISGIGEKTALSLIQKFGSLDGVYENLGSQKGKLLERLENGKAIAYLSKDLATIRRSHPEQVDYSSAGLFTFKKPEILEELGKYKLNSIIKTIGFEEPVYAGVGQIPDFEYTLLDSFPAGLDSELAYFLDFERGSIALCSDGQAILVLNAGWEAIKAFFEDGSIRKISPFLKEDIKELSHRGIDAINCVDAPLVAYVANSSLGKYGIEDLSMRILGISLAPKQEPKQLTLFDDGGESELTAQALEQYASATWRIYKQSYGQISENRLKDVFEEIEVPLVKILSDMEAYGVALDTSVLAALDEESDERIASISQQILCLANKGPDFNLNSPKQLGVLLFEELGLPFLKKTKTGYSTDIETLESIAHAHPIIPLLIELRSIAKLSSTYLKGLMKLVDPRTSRIHTSFNQMATVTGRLSSSNPNLQNIPARTEEGRQIRRAFVASGEGNVLIDADYSQIELRVLSHISGDANMVEAFRNNEDIHQRTASEVFSVSLDEVTKEMRSDAKAVNFGIVYGISDFGLAKNLGITKKAAASYIQAYFKRFPGVREYMDSIVLVAKAQGFVETMYGRRCYLPDINSRNHTIRSFAERVALNAPIQGSAADIMKIAMAKVASALEKGGFKARLILQVHDELLLDCPLQEASQVAALVKEQMEAAAEMAVPLVAEVGISKDWYGAK